MTKGQRPKKVYKDAGDRFRQISNTRAKVLANKANQVNRMLPQPSYDISAKDAQALFNYVDDAVTTLLVNLQKIIDGKPLRGKAEITDVYIAEETAEEPTGKATEE